MCRAILVAGALLALIQDGLAQCAPETLIGSDTALYDRFGSAVATSGNVIIVGALAAEKAYVFEWSGAAPGWLETAPLVPSQMSTTPDHFGRSVDVEGNLAVVGAPAHDASHGRVYVFEQSGSSWMETAFLTSSISPVFNTAFGITVDIEDGRIFVGRLGPGWGSIDVFEHNGSLWEQVDTFGPTEETRLFGTSISVDGERILVGATGDSGSFVSPGSAFVLERIGGQWVEQQQLLASDGQDRDHFGYKVALDGDTALISNVRFDGLSGGVYVFERDSQSGIWSEQDKLTVPDPRVLGAMALSGNTAFIGESANDTVGQYAGAVHRYDRAGSTWTLSETLYPSPGDSQAFGAFVAGDEDRLVIGAPSGDYAVVYDKHLGGTYCQVNPNSTGAAAQIIALGECQAAANELLLSATQLPPNKFGYFLLSQTQAFFANPGGSQGNLCIAGPIGRFQAQVQNSGPAGAIAITVDLTNVPLFGAILAGETWNFTCWFRDVGGNSNFTGGIEIPFQ